LNPKSLLKISLIILFFSSFLFSCEFKKPLAANNSKLHIIATLFPEYDFTRQIAGARADVKLLLPPGLESHSYEPTPQDIVKILNADVFIYTNIVMEPWAQKIAQNYTNSHTLILDVSRGINFLNAKDENLENTEPNHKHSNIDPHIWLDPLLAKTMVANIAQSLCKKDPANAGYYQKNADAYMKKLDKLNADFLTLFQNTKTKTIIYGGHSAFGYFAKRYSLTFISPYKGFSPDAEPSPQRLAELIKTIKTMGVSTIYFEELIDPKVSRLIVAQTGVKMVLLHGAHNVSKNELQSGLSYLNIMYDNLEKLKNGLGVNDTNSQSK
jgi:zinc transport system substrate-binding protein